MRPLQLTGVVTANHLLIRIMNAVGIDMLNWDTTAIKVEGLLGDDSKLFIHSLRLEKKHGEDSVLVIDLHGSGGITIDELAYFATLQQFAEVRFSTQLARHIRPIDEVVLHFVEEAV